MSKKIEFGSVLSAVGACLLLISLFLNWFQPALTAWQAFEVIDLLLAAIAVAVLVLVGGDLGAGGYGSQPWSVWLGAAAVIVVASQLINHPPSATNAGLMSGAWLALAGSILILGGAIMTASRVSFAVSVAQRGSKPEAEPADPHTLVEAASSRPRSSEEPVSSGQVQRAESQVHGELYPETSRQGPIGADDPELWHRSRSPRRDDEGTQQGGE